MSRPQHKKYQRGTRFNFSMPTLPSFEAQPRRIDIIQKQYHHDVVKFEFAKVSDLWVESIKTGVPVKFVWTQENITRTFIGYVSAVDSTRNKQRQNTMNIHCVAATYPLKDRVTRTFSNTSIPNAVKKIVTEFGFKFVGVDNPRKFAQLNIAGSSYWEWIQEQAKRIGYGVVVDGLNFIFMPVDKLVDLSFSYAPILSTDNQGIPTNNQFLDNTLLGFKVTNGEHVESAPELRMSKTVAGVNPVTSQVFMSTSDPVNTGSSIREATGDTLFSEQRTGEVANDPNSAKFTSEGLAKLGRLSIPAKVTAQGDPRLRPFGSVVISGTGEVTDGFWIVQEVTHSIHQVGDYLAELTVLTDGVGLDRESPFRSRDISAVGTVNLNQAVKNNGNPLFLFASKDVYVQTPKLVKNSSAQGFKRTPSLWKRKAGA